MFNGDELPALTQDRLDLLAKMLPLYPKQARPLDLYESNFSSKWLLRVDTSFDTWWVAALFNWEEEARSFSIRFDSDGLKPDRRYRIYDFWNQRPLGIARGSITIPGVASHDCKVIAIRENRPHPWLLSTDYHLTQGGVELGQLSWDEESLTLSGVFIGRRAGNAVLTFTVPETYAIRAIDCPGAAHQVTEEGVRLELTGLGGEDRSFKLMFA
ncbi:hypothetical protein A8990_14624 [Paenibacillus taihuensis]|uniref:Alpha galactosidase C-terminal domain-containing protein n=1 Tax=Paenibacillus taihuensis TaxID=1156355 RepID=A0A3D9QTY1_9BACL|nr:hypothetical protein [Paenibacillus taihuensis]REE66972.1 hypothetical protein A8990_14624 [Paenibacillus taihuensis]